MDISGYMRNCRLCARRCSADRTAGRYGYCGMGDAIAVSRAMLHYWEEPCLAAENGSGAIFFAGCSLGCIYCQNFRISNVRGSGGTGKEGVFSPGGIHYISPYELAQVMLDLQTKGAENIDLVTPTHFIPQIAEAVSLARSFGLELPVVYNTGSYETCDSVRMLKDTVDIWMPDLKYYDSSLSERYSSAPDYFSVASSAIKTMYEISGPAVIKDDGRLLRGVLVRHLVLPGHTKDSMKILSYLHEAFGDNIFISIMSQYTPTERISDTCPELSRRITTREYNKVVDYALELGISNAFIQDRATASESFIPDF